MKHHFLLKDKRQGLMSLLQDEQANPIYVFQDQENH